MVATRKKRSKTVDLFIVTELIKEGERPQHIYTITASQEEANEYVNKKLQLDNKDHFKSWCELRNLDINGADTWNSYVGEVLLPNTPVPLFAISKVIYRVEDMAGLLRLFNRCKAIGCSYDNEVETVCSTLYDSIPNNPMGGECKDPLTEALKSGLNSIDANKNNKA